MEYLLLFVIKVFDNVLMTSKTILIQKNRAFIAALTVILSQIIFYKLISVVSGPDGDMKLYLISVASGVGTYIAVKYSDKFSKERLFINTILSNNKKAMRDFARFLKSSGLVYQFQVNDKLLEEDDKMYTLIVYAETKVHSRLVDKYIDEHSDDFTRYVP